MSGKSQLDYSTLNITLKEAVAAKEHALAEAIKRMLAINKVEDPGIQTNTANPRLQLYEIDLSAAEVDSIIKLFLKLEVEYAGEDGDTTPTSEFYASLTDKWNEVFLNL